MIITWKGRKSTFIWQFRWRNGSLGTTFIFIQKRMNLKMSSAKRPPFVSVSMWKHYPICPSAAYLRQWTGSALVQIMAPSRRQAQCWVIVNWTPRNKLHWNFSQNTKLFIHENASEHIVCETAAILSRRDELLKNLGYVLRVVTGEAGQGPPVQHDVHTIESSLRLATTVKPVCNDHLYDEINYLWFIQ